MKKKFCLYQMKTREDTENTWTCGAHLTEGYIYKCPSDGSEIMFDAEVGKPCIESCEDFAPILNETGRLDRCW